MGEIPSMLSSTGCPAHVQCMLAKFVAFADRGSIHHIEESHLDGDGSSIFLFIYLFFSHDVELNL